MDNNEHRNSPGTHKAWEVNESSDALSLGARLIKLPEAELQIATGGQIC